jgi:hypothetical protein
MLDYILVVVCGSVVFVVGTLIIAFLCYLLLGLLTSPGAEDRETMKHNKRVERRERSNA